MSEATTFEIPPGKCACPAPHANCRCPFKGVALGCRHPYGGAFGQPTDRRPARCPHGQGALIVTVQPKETTNA